MEKESRAGKLKDSNTRYSLTIDREFKDKLQKIAENDKRSLNNLIIKVLEEKFKE